MPEHVLTLIAAETARAELKRVADAAAQALSTTIDWLAPDQACDIGFDGLPDTALSLVQGLAIDAVVQKSAGRRKKLLVADMESTVIANEMLDEMAELAGLRANVAEITRRAMNGEIDFAGALKSRVALFKGQPESLLAAAAQRIVYMPGARQLIATMNASGARTVLVSGGFRVFSSAVGTALGFTLNRANDLIVENGVLTGTIREPILAAGNKRTILDQMARSFGISADETLAVGDGANDLPMLGAAGLGVAFHPKPHVRDRIATRIEHTDLTSLLYLQGYRSAEFVS